MVMDQLVIPLSSPSLDLMVLDPAGIHLLFMYSLDYQSSS
jgi:hypothetical protein